MNRIFDVHDMACRVADFIPDNAAHFGMLVAMNKKFHSAFKPFAEQAKKLRENTKRFVELRDFIIDDLTTRRQYAKEDDRDNDMEYNDETPENYWTLFYREGGRVMLYLMRKSCDTHHVSVSASNFKWQDFDVASREEWTEKFSILMVLPGPFKLGDDGRVMPMGTDDELYSEDDDDF